MLHIKNFIGGELVAPHTGAYLDNINPATGHVYSFVPASDEHDVHRAVEAAERAFSAWSTTSAEERARILERLAQCIEEDAQTLALAETEDNGKPLTLASNVDIPRAAKNFRFFAHAATQFASEAHHTTLPTGDTVLNYTLRQPIGVVGCISPWNLPLYLFTWKIAPALAAGNCVIAKPSELTPMTAFLLSELCIKAGLPAGVLNIVHGVGAKAGAAVVAHPRIHAISFTGGTKTGAVLAESAAPMFKKLSLELGGKNPAVIFADCNYEKTLNTLLQASFTNQGQICLCASRILIERPLYKRFREDFVRRAQELRCGDPLENSTQQGAVISKQHFDKVLSYVALAKQEGGTILCGGHAVQVEGRCSGGWFIAPTVIESLPMHCRTNQEEIFGPVVTLQLFDTEEEALVLANSSEYGLAATLWTENLSRAHRMAARIQAGIVWVNCWMLRDLRTPFGGVKHSGVGREGGVEALRFFTEAKNVCLSV